jgi:hypothetical protein
MDLKSIWNKYKKTILIVLIAIGVMLFIAIRESGRKTIIADLATSEANIEKIKKDRDYLQKENTKLIRENMVIQEEKDSISKAKVAQEIALNNMVRRHKREVDSLISASVPSDTVYAKLQTYYPNYFNEPLPYPFSGGQIRDIYSTTLQFPRLQKEYTLQTSILQSCNSLNAGYRDAETNYKAQIENLNKNISTYTDEIGNKDNQLKLTEKKLNKKSFWNWVYKAGAVSFAALAIFK